MTEQDYGPIRPLSAAEYLDSLDDRIMADELSVEPLYRFVGMAKRGRHERPFMTHANVSDITLFDKSAGANLTLRTMDQSREIVSTGIDINDGIITPESSSVIHFRKLGSAALIRGYLISRPQISIETHGI